MVRSVVQFTDKQFAVLKSRSTQPGRSIAEIVRQGVDAPLVQSRTPAVAQRRELAARGRFRSGVRDLARHHDNSSPSERVHRHSALLVRDTAVLVANRLKLCLVGCVSFDCMRRPGIKLALAFDNDLQQQGLASARA